jgi:hypothetical protein
VGEELIRQNEGVPVFDSDTHKGPSTDSRRNKIPGRLLLEDEAGCFEAIATWLTLEIVEYDRLPSQLGIGFRNGPTIKASKASRLRHNGTSNNNINVIVPIDDLSQKNKHGSRDAHTNIQNPLK